MSTFSTKINIEAPINEVWEVLADIGNIYVWNAGVVHSHATNDQKGIGASRHCDLGRKNYLDEDVVGWDEKKRLTMRIVKTNLPFKSADIRFTLEAENSHTIVTVSPIYEVKFGVIGKLLDFLFVRRTYMKGMNSLLKGLKKHVEASK